MFIEGCSCSDPGRSDTAANFLRSLRTSDVVVWTDGSVSSPLGAGVAGIHAVCGDVHPPSHCPTQLALSPLASQLLNWYMALNGDTLI